MWFWSRLCCLSPAKNSPSGAQSGKTMLALTYLLAGFLDPWTKCFFNIRIFHPNAASNLASADAFQKHEKEKKRCYNDRIINVEKASFIPLVFGTNGTIGKEADRFHKRLGSLIAAKRNISYSEAISYIRRRIRFGILRTALITLRGFRGNAPDIPCTIMEDSDIDLIPASQMHF